MKRDAIQLYKNTLRQNHKMKIITTLLLLFLFGCASSPRFRSSPSEKEASAQANPPSTLNNIPEDAEVFETVIGAASYYGHDFHGKLTSNGETYDMYGITAAHPYYPPDTILRITNLSNNKVINVRVNDHMPKHPSRIIDLSFGAAKELDMIDRGIAQIKLEVIKWGKPK
ncbi:MAG: septal ring lytic transglycosylase RlpA family protein [Bacteroidetes bacterium]|nr:septal ring lytic transglycosylase RlpA family protein [Bacteroidota bacterium]